MEGLFKTLVVGVDLSVFSKAVVKQALALKKQWDTDLVLVHVPALITELPLKAEEKKRFKEKLVQDLYREYKLTTNDARIEIGQSPKPSEEIIRVAKKEKAPLILIGHVSQSAITRFFLGSTAERLALTSPFPVWIHRGSKTVAPKKILVPTDLHKPGVGVSWAKKLSDLAKTTVLYVSRPVVPVMDYDTWSKLEAMAEAREEKVIERAKASWEGAKFVSKIGEPAREILKLSKGHDLIVMAPHDRPKFLPTFGSVTAKVVRDGKTPILIVQAQP